MVELSQTMVVVKASSLLEQLPIVEQQQHNWLHDEALKGKDDAHSSQPALSQIYQYQW